MDARCRPLHRTRAEFVSQVSRDYGPPGRGLADPGFSLPVPAPQPGRRKEHPSIHAAGGEWPDDELDVPPAEGPPPHPKPITEPLAPGTSYAGEQIDPFTHDVLEDEDEDEEAEGEE